MIGERLGNRYKVESRIGSGGMAVVYLAKDVILDRYVAVKVLNESLSNDESFVDRFRREARAAASLSHPNVVGIYDVGQDDATHYIVMEYIEGKTLKERIREEGRLPIAEAIVIGEQIADALEHAHENNIVHRDVKSHNIMIGPRGRVKVADFGIARATSSQTITHTGSVMGSVHYFSPEQARGSYIGEKSDIYSLGVVLYEMVTGELPFSGDSPIAIALKHLQEQPADPKDKRPDLPQSIDNVIRRAMCKDPHYRYASAAELQQDLHTALNPSRINEARWDPVDLDGEQTVVMPAIKPPPLHSSEEEATVVATPAASVNEQNVNSSASLATSSLSRMERDGRSTRGSGNGGRLWWKKTGFTVLTVLLVVILAGFGLNTLWSVMSKDEVEVPEVVGMNLEEARAALQEKGLQAEAIEQENEEEPGTVFRQDPEAKQQVKQGYTVKLYVSEDGGQHVSLPNMINSPESEARQALYDLGFSPQNIEVKPLDDEHFTPGHVIRQEPASGSRITVNSTVTLFVRPDADMVEIPDLNGEFQSAAEEKLRELGFKVYRNGPEGAVYDREVNVPLYRVFGSTPEPGTMLAKGEVVRLHVSLNNTQGEGSGGGSAENDDADDSQDDEETKESEE